MKNQHSKPRVGIFGLTGCAGDQLQILNCEDQLLWLAGELDFVDWVMVSSDNDHQRPLDIGFVEGVVATQRDLSLLRSVRGRASFLVALGTCAVWGGLPAMRNDLARDVLISEVCRDEAGILDTVEARPATDFVTERPPEPEDGIELGEELTYEVKVKDGIMSLKFVSEGHKTKTFIKI